MTWSEDLNRKLNNRLKDGRILNSTEELTKNITNFKKVIISKHEMWTLEILESLLMTLKALDIEIYYMTKLGEEEKELQEIKELLHKLEVENIYKNPEDIDNLIFEIENISLFDDESYSNEAVFIIEPEDTKDVKEKEITNNSDKKDTLEDKYEIGESKNKSLEIKNEQAVVKHKKENAFVFGLNYIYKILRIFVNVIITFIDNIQWLVISVVISAAAYIIFKELGIETISQLIEKATEFITNFKK